MGVRYPSVATTTLQAGAFNLAAETIILTTPPLSLPIDGAQVLIQWFVNVQTGPTANGIRTLLRRGAALTSTLINGNSLSALASANLQQQWGGVYVDTPGSIAGVQYSLTLQQNAATGNGLFSDGCLMAIVL